VANLYPNPVVLPCDPILVVGSGAGPGRFGAKIGFWNRESVGVLIDRIAIPGGNGYQAQLRYHNEPLTNGFVQIAAMAYNHGAARVASANALTYPVIMLPKPMYLEPGETIDVAIQNAGNYTGSTTIQASAIGRQTMDVPKDRWLPYFTAFQTATYDMGGAATINDVSSPQDLGNPFDTDLVIERMIGTVLTATNAAVGFVDNGPRPAWMAFLARLYDHLDRTWVPTPTPVPSVIDVLTRSWPLNFTLAAKGYAKAEFFGTANTDSAASLYASAVLGLAGARRIS